MQVSIRKCEKFDIPNKVKWINNPVNNTYLHYELPLEIEKTENWYDKNKNRADRYDAVIEVDGAAVGLIGLLSIDNNNRKAEYYVTIGEHEYLGKGVASKATKLLLEYAFKQLGLNRVYLFTECENLAAIKSYERVGFKCEGVIKHDIFSKGRFVNRYLYGISKEDFYGNIITPIHMVNYVENNSLYVKREDFIPFSFGGNKARKAQLFFEEIDRNTYDCVVTYGTGSSNHCRVVSNMAYAREMKCYIISPEEVSDETYNSKLMELFGTEITVCPVSKVHDTIENKLKTLKEKGVNPYFIAGGGHGNIGTQAYVNCYEEIRQYELKNNVHFDYIFHASGTGTTQAGLICGQLINRDERKIVGISIARKNPIGREVILESIQDYIRENKIFVSEDLIDNAIIFVDDFVGGGYGISTDEVNEVVQNMMRKNGLPLDKTYTGKAFAGMLEYVNKNGIMNKNILFIHTGGTPLFFDSLN